MSGNIYIYAEQRNGTIQNVSFELIGKAKELASKTGGKIVSVLLGHNIRNLAEELIAYGSDEAIVVDHEMLKEYTTEPYTKALTQIIKEGKPEIFLIGATTIGRDLAPRTSARIATGLTADCTSLEIDNETKNLLMTRPAFGGNIMATIVCENHRPQMATVRSGVMSPLEKDTSRKGTITSVEVPFVESDMNIKIRSIVKEKKKKTDIMEQNILISAGRGVGEDGLKLLKELADVLGGEVASSRAVIDSGWLERDRQVGQTGKTVRPNLYIACGISGAIQHVVGMEGSDLIIAINKNPNAPIFEVADVGIVGDAKVIIPKLTQILKK